MSQAEIRRGFRLVGETCEVGDDPLVWRRHLAGEMCRLVGGVAAFHDEEHVAARRADSRTLGMVVLGIEGPAAVAGLMQYEAAGGFNTHPFFPFIHPRATRPWTLTRREILPDDRPYYGSVVISEYKRAADLDDTIHSRQPIPRPGWANMLALFRGIGARPFSVRERRLVHLVHEEVARLWRLPAPADPADALTPRQRQIVHRLRAGDSEKQVAFRLGITRQTVHGYVKDLHRRLGVSNRFDLLGRLAPPPARRRPRLSSELPGT